MIVISAGRRIDEVDAKEARFPLENVDEVAEAIRSRLADLSPDVLICSAACGADLIALDAAAGLGIRRRIVLPFAPPHFRHTSVTDRPGNSTWDWGAIFDDLIRLAVESDDLIILPPRDDGDETAAYVAVNRRIIDEARSLAEESDDQKKGGGERAQVRAVIIWEGSSRGEGDLTAELAALARKAGIPVEQVRTRADADAGGGRPRSEEK